MADDRHIIWTSDVDYEDWKNDLESEYPELTEDERVMKMYTMQYFK